MCTCMCTCTCTQVFGSAHFRPGVVQPMLHTIVLVLKVHILQKKPKIFAAMFNIMFMFYGFGLFFFCVFIVKLKIIKG